MTEGMFVWPLPVKGLAADLRAADKLMLASVGKSQLGKAAAKLIGTGGKRLRPALALTSARIQGKAPTPEAVNAAAAVEFIHLASLIHDDVLDKSLQRRQQPSAAAAYGDGFAVLMGDFLLAKAWGLAAVTGLESCQLLADAIASMAEGETMGETEAFSASYYRSARLKTAGLFSAAASAGATCGDLSPQARKALQQFGEHFGLAFQIIDDVHDRNLTKAKRSLAIAKIDRLNQAAVNSLAGLSGPAADSLRALPEAYRIWALPL